MKNKKTEKKQIKSLLLFLMPFYFILFSCSNNFMQNLLSNPSIIKVPGAEVTQPTVMGIPAPNTIAVNNVTIIDNRGSQIAEYAISQTNNVPAESLSWQTNTSFSGLSPATTYFVFARSAENSHSYAGYYNVSDPIRFYNVSFHANGATSGIPPEIQSRFQNETIIIPTRGNLTKTGFAFGCWNTQPDGYGEDLIPGHLFQVTDNQILYVKWVAEQVHTFTFLPPQDNVPIVSGITISQTGTGNYPTTGILEITNPEDYTLIEWFYGSIKLGEGAILELDATDIRYNVVGTHSITVVVWQDDRPYSLRISFIIIL
ncbi:MAG: InlB B-repeat-containing protein [Treponema sp.]|nr:InlB B-repeat-containing protein [Treponema sp.]